MRSREAAPAGRCGCSCGGPSGEAYDVPFKVKLRPETRNKRFWF